MEIMNDTEFEAAIVLIHEKNCLANYNVKLQPGDRFEPCVSLWKGTVAIGPQDDEAFEAFGVKGLASPIYLSAYLPEKDSVGNTDTPKSEPNLPASNPCPHCAERDVKLAFKTDEVKMLQDTLDDKRALVKKFGDALAEKDREIERLGAQVLAHQEELKLRLQMIEDLLKENPNSQALSNAQEAVARATDLAGRWR